MGKRPWDIRKLLVWVFCRQGLLPQSLVWEKHPRTWSCLPSTERSSHQDWSREVW